MRRSLLLALAWTLTVSSGLAADEAMAPEVTISAQDCQEYAPAVAYNSNRDQFLVVWFEVCSTPTTYRRVLSRRLQGDGRPVDGTVLVVEPVGGDGHDRMAPAVAYDRVADRYLVVYAYDYGGDGSDWDIRGLFLAGTGNGTVGDEITFAASGHHERVPVAAYSTISQKFMVSWHREDIVNGNSIWGAVFAFGAAPTFFGVATGAHRSSPDLSYDPFANRFAVSYDSVTDVYGVLVDPAGGVGAETPTAATSELEYYSATASCENWQHLAAWQAFDTPGGDYDIYARFLFGNGAYDGESFWVAGYSGDELNVEIACRFGDIDYLLVFETEWGDATFGIAGKRIRATKVTRPGFDVRAPNAGETGLAHNPAVAGGRTGWLVAWEHKRQGSPYSDIHGRVVWELFADGFEWGDAGCWSATSL
jgi:hypothetical protein